MTNDHIFLQVQGVALDGMDVKRKGLYGKDIKRLRRGSGLAGRKGKRGELSPG